MGAGAPDISIVLPAHNEAGNIAPIAAAIAQAMALAGSYEIVFVDDGSTDGTLAAIRAAARDPGHPLCLVHAQLRPSGGAARRHAPRARTRRDRDGLRLRASARTDPETGRGLEGGREGCRDPARRRGRGGAQAAFLAALLSVPRRDRRRAHRAGQRRLHAARPRGGRHRQRNGRPGHLPARAGALARLPAHDDSLPAWHAPERRQQVLGGAHGGACALRHRDAQPAPVALRDLARARLRAAQPACSSSTRSSASCSCSTRWRAGPR